MAGETLGQVRARYNHRPEGLYINVDGCEDALDSKKYFIRTLSGEPMPDDHILEIEESVELVLYEYFHPECAVYSERRSWISFLRAIFEQAGFENFQVKIENLTPGKLQSPFETHYCIKLADKTIIRMHWHQVLLEIDYTKTSVKNGLEARVVEVASPGVVLVEGYYQAIEVLTELRHRMESPIPWLGPAKEDC